MIKAWILAALLVIAPVACAQKDPYAPGSPAVIAFDLYMTCIRAEFTVSRPQLGSMKELADYITYLDDKCLTWAVIWFTPFVGYTIDKMSGDRMNSFIVLRQGVLDNIVKELSLSVPKKALK